MAVDATAPSLVVIRNSYDEGWSATVDGAPAEVLPADGFLQGVAVDAGHHEVALTYRDPAIGRGLAVSAVVWLALGAAFAGCAFVERRRRRGRALSLGTSGAGARGGYGTAVAGSEARTASASCGRCRCRRPVTNASP